MLKPPLQTQQILDMGLLSQVEEIRQEANGKLDESLRGQMGQFMTPSSVATILASMFDDLSGDISVLEGGAGVGSLIAALTQRAVSEFKPTKIDVTGYELEPVLAEGLKASLKLCAASCHNHGVSWGSSVHQADFIRSSLELLAARKNGIEGLPRFNKAIINPPYLKIAAKSPERLMLREAGIETGNLYSGFVAMAIKLLEPGGELVAITPRSFCNGPYFKDFRNIMFQETALKKITVFRSRKTAFKGDKVLQENVIFHLIKGAKQSDVCITSLSGPDDTSPTVRITPIEDVINPRNPDQFIHIVTDDLEAEIASEIGGLPCSLEDLKIGVSTGRVVGFRTPENLRQDPEPGSIPLIYPIHFSNGLIEWPIPDSRKPNSLALNPETERLTVPNGIYVLVKRLTAKEEKRRIVAAVYEPLDIPEDVVGFENKTNYFHSSGQPLEQKIAEGLTAFLNSTIVDQYFRQFNGHTQVNATDLRSLRYPTVGQLRQLGGVVISERKANQNGIIEQQEIDELVSGYLNR